MTPVEAAAIVSKARRCTEATMLAFGIKNAIPQMGSGCLEHLTHNLFDVKKLPYEGHPLKDLVGLKVGKYLILTSGHAMALVDGILVDTMRGGFDHRKIEHIWEVSK